MQRFYCVALSSLAVMLASAAIPDTSLMSDLSSQISLKPSLHTSAVKQKAPATRAAEPQWGEWQMVGTGTFHIDSGLEIFLGLPEWKGDFPGINVYSRSDASDASTMQYKFEGIYNKADVIVDYDADTQACKVYPQPTNIDAGGMLLDVLDLGTLYELHGQDWQGMTPEEAQKIADTYSAYNYFVPELGRFYLYLSYITDGIQDAVSITDCTLQLDGVADVSVTVKAEDFYKDAANMNARVEFPAAVSTCRYKCFKGILTQDKLNAVMNNEEGVKTLTETSTVALDCSEGIGMYTIVAVTFSSKGTPLEFGCAEYTYTPSSDEGWTPLGRGVYSSDTFESLLGYPRCTYEVSVDRSDDNPSVYRIRNPYGEDCPIESCVLKVKDFDIYLIFDATDPDKVFFVPTNLGIDAGGEWLIAVNRGYMLEVIQGKKTKDGDYGKLEGNVISFPANSVFVTCENIELYGGEKGSWYTGNQTGKLSLTIPEESAVSGVVADDAAPEYFNLQGIRIATPEKGSVVLERRGDSIVKKIIR